MIPEKLFEVLNHEGVASIATYGTGYLIEGTASFLDSGDEYTEVKKSFPWARAVLEIKPASSAQTL